MKLSRFFAAALAFVLTLGLPQTSTYAAESEEIPEGTIAIIYTNDVHSGVTQITDDEGYVTNMGYAGVAGFADALSEILGEDYVTLVDAGDATQGEAVATLSKGRYLVEIINEAGYDIFTPGNHEFDYGMEQMLANMALLEGAVVSANFIDLKTDEPVFDEYAIISYGDVDVAYVGVSTPHTFTSSTPAYFQDDEGNFIYSFREGNNGADLYETVQSAVDAAVAEGAEYVICVGHLGAEEPASPWSSYSVIENTTGIDAFIDGHSHTVMPGETVENADGEEVLLTQTGTKLANIGCLTISPDGEIAAELIVGFDGVNADVEAFINDIISEYEADLAEIVAVTEVDLVINDPETGERMVRSRETNLGNLAADAFRYVLGNGEGEPSDIAIISGGGVRVDVPAGDVTFGQIIAVFPFNSVGMVVKATGQEILDALEMGARNVPAENGAFLQVSGLEYTVDTSVETSVETDDTGGFVAVNGEYRVKDVTVGGEQLDTDAVYTVASIDYMLQNGGDGFTMFADNEIAVNPVTLDNQLLISYIQDNLGGVIGEEYADPYGQGRITILSESDDAEEDTAAEESEANNVTEVGDEVPADEEAPNEVIEMVIALPFTDVPADSEYYAFIARLYEAGIISGTGNGLYNPDFPMTAAMAVTLLYNHAGKPDVIVTGTEWYAEAFGWAVEEGIVTGSETPNASVSFAAFDEYLAAYAEYSGLEPDAAQNANIELTEAFSAVIDELTSAEAFTRSDASAAMGIFLAIVE